MATVAGTNLSGNDSIVMSLDTGNVKSYNTNNFEVQYIVVAGGGGGSSRHGGGAGAGGLIYGTATLTHGSSYTVTIGAGGAGAAAASATSGVQGSNSVFNSQTAIGGGYGTSSNTVGGGSGGSGGGSRAQPTQYGGGSATSGQGFPGADGDDSAGYSIGGGGGGAAGPGRAGLGSDEGFGGPGKSYSNLFGTLFGETGHFAGGGGGGGAAEGGTGGIGGGGDGYFNGAGGEAGAANTGGGGGAGGQNGATNYVGGAGGSGIVLLRYPGAPRAQGGTIYGQNGHTIHAFTSSSSFTSSAASAVGDISGNYRYGTFNNNAAYSSFGNGSITFDGTGDYVLTNYGQGLNPATTPFTVEAWVKSGTTSSARMWIDVGNNGASETARFYATLITGGADNVGIQTNGWDVSNPVDTNWHYQAIVMDGSTARMYDNGILSDTESYTSYTIEGNFILGGRYDLYNWLGQIANFKVYNKALSATEVAANFEATRNRFGI